MTFRQRVAIPLLICLLVTITSACSRSSNTPSQDTAVAAKVYITESGMYELTAADLKAAGLGWDNLDPTKVRLFYRGREQPLWAEGEGKSLTLRFYGQAVHSRYTSENVYWLQPGDGPARRMEQRRVATQPLQTTPADRYLASVRTEENQLYSPRVEEGDHWFWAFLPAPQTKSFEVPLSAVASGSPSPSTVPAASVRVQVWGSSEAPESPDHHVRVRVNDNLVADETWDGQGHHVIEAGLPANLLRDGVNVVTIEAPGDTGAAADIIYVDWIEIHYPRFLTAENDRLVFEGSDGMMRLTGFSGPATVFDVTDSENPAQVSDILEEKQARGTAITFHAESGRHYEAVGPEGYRRPRRIARTSTSPNPSLLATQGLHAAGNGADYVAIGPPDLLEPLAPLLAWREQQGLKVLAVPVESIYDQFNDGLPEPEAVRAFLKYARQSWQPAPRYLLLVGDATYDPQGYVTPPEANRVPSFLVQTVFGGETASDTLFAQLDDDLKPDIAVGRMPARTPQQVRTLVEKTLAYEKQTSQGEWQRRVMTVADGQDPSFRKDARAFVEQLPGGFEAVEVYPPAGDANASQQVRRHLTEGNLLVTYYGHGSITQWGKDRIFTTADTEGLDNGDRLPVVLNMTCLTGLFTHPDVDSLAETMLWEEEGGAVAVLAATSLTLPNDQSFLSEALVETLLRNPQPTLGEAVLEAKRRVPADKAGTRDVMQTFLLFGDPALHLAYPR